MNAILDQECEALVLTNEAIEVHLSYLRPAVEAVQAKLDALDTNLNEKIDTVDKRLNEKIDALDTKLSEKIDTVDKRLNEKIDALDTKLSEKVDALDKSLSEKLDQTDKAHRERYMNIQASQNGLKWFIGSLTLIASGVSIARTLGWI